jgi:outer membrane protein assembly factor BamB
MELKKLNPLPPFKKAMKAIVQKFKKIITMKQNIPMTYLLTLIMTLYGGCSDETNPTNTNDADQSIATGLAGNPSLNRFVLANKGGEILKVDVGTGSQERFFSFEEVIVSSMTVVNDVLYAGATDNSMNAIGLQHRQLMWDVPLLEYENTVLADPDVIVKDGVAYAVGKTGVLVAADATSGKILWKYSLHPSGRTDATYTMVGTPTVTADKVIIGTYFDDRPNYAHIIEKNTGKSIWVKELPEDEYGSGTLRVSGNTLLISNRVLLALDMNTGNTIWEFKPGVKDYNTGIPVVSGDKVLLQGASGLAAGKLFCLSLSNGQKIWEIDAGISTTEGFTPTVVDNLVIGVEEQGSAFGGFYSLKGNPFVADIATGKIIWKNADIFVATSPVYANGRLFFHGHNPKLEGTVEKRSGLLCLDAKNGEFLWVNNYFAYSDVIPPIVVADNGVFRTGNY